MKLVEFKNGSFGVRKATLFGYAYLDLRGIGFWWSRRDSSFSSYCRGSRTVAERLLQSLTDKGSPR